MTYKQLLEKYPIVKSINAITQGTTAPYIELKFVHKTINLPLSRYMENSDIIFMILDKVSKEKIGLRKLKLNKIIEHVRS